MVRPRHRYDRNSPPRRSRHHRHGRHPERAAGTGRGYEAGDLPLLAIMGVAAGYLALVILALYIQSEAVEPLYRHPQRLWLGIPLAAYWTSRMWLLARRGALEGDPVLFAVRDRVSWLMLAAGAAVALLATS